MTLLPPVEHYLGVGPLFHDIIPSKTILVEWPLRGLLTATLGCDCSEAALFLAKRAPNSENKNSEDGELDN